MKRTILTILLSAACVGATAQSVPFILTGTDPRSFAMATVGTENLPAGNVLSGKTLEMGAAYGNTIPRNAWKGDITFSGYGNTGPISTGIFGHIHPGRRYEAFNDRAVSEGGYTTGEIALGANAAFMFPSHFSVGVGVTIISSTLSDSAKGSGMGFDISGAYSTGGLIAELALRNLGSGIKYGRDKYALPSLAVAGASYRAGGFNARAELGYYLSGALMAGAGVEQTLWETVSLRAGFHYGDEAHVPTYVSLGLGVRIAGVRLDLTCLPPIRSRVTTLAGGLGYSF